MGLWSYFKRDKRSNAPASSAGDEVQRLRVQSRQRLIGAAVLIAVGVVGFPLVFETTPRPIATDIPIEIARREQPPVAAPAPREPEPAAVPVRPEQAAPALTPERAAPAATPERTTPASTHERSPAPQAVPSIAAPPKPAAEPAVSKLATAKPRPEAAPPPAKPKSEPAKPARSDDARARALLEGKDAKTTIVAAAAGRFVVQVGAFSEEGAARDMQQKVEKLGIKTHTQQVATQAGSRILRVRVGPFPSRDEADRVATRLESAGVSSAVLAL